MKELQPDKPKPKRKPFNVYLDDDLSARLNNDMLEYINKNKRSITLTKMIVSIVRQHYHPTEVKMDSEVKVDISKVEIKQMIQELLGILNTALNQVNIEEEEDSTEEFNLEELEEELNK